MNTEQHINWSEAQHVSQHVQQRKTAYQKDKLIEFAESDYEMLNYEDFEFYIRETGLDETVLMNLATSITMQRALKVNEITEALRSKNYWQPMFKYDPFKKTFRKYNVWIEKWLNVSLYDLEKELETANEENS